MARAPQAAQIPRVAIDRRRIDAVVFDLDGVITRTASVHAKAWKAMFDDFLAAQPGPPPPFDIEHDYLEHVDGKPRLDGARSFLAARGLALPEGTAGDAPGTPTVWGLSNRKNDLVLELLARDGAEVFETSIAFVKALRAAGVRTAIVSSSANCAAILASVHASDLFDVRVDGVVAAERGLAGKPAPDIFLAAATALGVAPQRCVVVEDAIAGVEAGRAGGFALVVGVDRAHHAQALREHGADVVVRDLGELELEDGT